MADEVETPEGSPQGSSDEELAQPRGLEPEDAEEEDEEDEEDEDEGEDGPSGEGGEEDKGDGPDIGKIRHAIAGLVREKGCGPILIRLAWHDAGTFCASSRTGGPRGCMRFAAGECAHAANAGLQKARELLAPIHEANPSISTADLWALAACTAVETMGGPRIKFRKGRKDAEAEEDSAPEGRLPDATQGTAHLREVFGRMGFSDRDIVALSGAHTVGHCHADRSGFVGPWTERPLEFNNEYFKLLLDEQWEEKEYEEGPRKGCKYFESQKESTGPKAGKLIMLPTDMALLSDDTMKKFVERYARSQQNFFRDFAQAFRRLLELGVEFPKAPLPKEWKVPQGEVQRGQRRTRRLTLELSEKPRQGAAEAPAGSALQLVRQPGVRWYKYLHDTIGWGETQFRELESQKELARALAKTDLFVLFSEGAPQAFAEVVPTADRVKIVTLAAPSSLFSYFASAVVEQVWSTFCTGEEEGASSVVHVISNWSRESDARSLLDMGFTVGKSDTVTEYLPLAQGLWCDDRDVAEAVRLSRRAARSSARGGGGGRESGGSLSEQAEIEVVRKLKETLQGRTMRVGDLASEANWNRIQRDFGFRMRLNRFVGGHAGFLIDEHQMVTGKSKRSGRRREKRHRSPTKTKSDDAEGAANAGGEAAPGSSDVQRD
eukprot:Hpha_TRINITY_DN16614_c2_g1::TRINITY_DN16614_c2_g1_i1::g.180768::m.180768/K00428/E1.11.1.5; cytochrome c peroxidase